ncbi:hypothetical protein CAPTEDRAFT_224961 [Capitella teleta]|uniref:Uncharacterized protein n=1 Tax=Capitella teleta TaxID=283909 RepID=R7V4W1_CAPTE|nr:hypothetical protein CAPTEDRAFT_224961 [Capitella teleta]|eukprot:ELU13594.1 hypothetical protein CAPTEDRAFT_224961 [Capitella teleta]
MAPQKVDAITRGLNTTVESFNYEVKTFWKERSVSRLTLISFLHLNIANVLTLLVFLAPGWGWTQEISGTDALAGEYYGFYGVWFTCWGDVEGNARREVCELTTTLPMPSFWGSFQAMSVVTALSGMFSFIACMTYICVQTMNKKSSLVLLYAFLTGLTGLFSTSWIVVFAVGFHDSSWNCCDPDLQRQVVQYHLWYCFVFAVMAALFYFAALTGGIFEALDVRKEFMRAMALRQKHESEMLQYGDQKKAKMFPCAW